MSQSGQSVNSIGVIVGRDLVGDALIKLPFLRALRHAFPKAEIHWITSNGPTAYATLLREPTQGLINVVEECPVWVREGHPSIGSAPAFDLLIDTRNRWKRALEAKQIPHRIFLAIALRGLLSDKRPPLWQKPRHIVDRLLQQVELAAGYMPPSTGSLPVPDELMLKAKKILLGGPIYVGLAPGAGNPVKIWPRWKFEKLAALQAEKGRVPVFILGPQELSSYDMLTAIVPSARFPLQDYNAWGTDQLTIEHTLAVAKLLNVAVANDSGVGHMLAAADCPLVSLFGPTLAEKLAPRVSKGKIIRAQDFGSNEMKKITWEAVDTAVDGLLVL